MNANISVARKEAAYEKYAQEYLASLPLEHFMESTDQSTQRGITVASLDLVKAEEEKRRADDLQKQLEAAQRELAELHRRLPGNSATGKRNEF